MTNSTHNKEVSKSIYTVHLQSASYQMRLLPYAHLASQPLSLVPICWFAHAETAAAKLSGPCAWDDDVAVVG